MTQDQHAEETTRETTRRRRRSTGRRSSQAPTESREPATESRESADASARQEQPAAEAPAQRRRSSRRRRSAKARAEPAQAELEAVAEPTQVAAAEEQPPAEAPAPRRRSSRRRRSARARAEPAQAELEAVAEPTQVAAAEEQAAAEAPAPRRRSSRRRRSARAEEEAAEAVPEPRPSSRAAARARRGTRRGKTKELPASERIEFAHPSEREFARIMDFYGLRWEYEPRSFPLRWEADHIYEMFTPDFYLPDLDLYVELTTMKQSLVTEKNRKLRRIRELHPDLNIKLLYRRDYYRLLAKYGVGPLAKVEVRGIDRVLFTTHQIQERVKELGYQISKDYEGMRPVLVGVLRGVMCFMSDLMRQISLPVAVDFMAISPFAGGSRPGVRITKDLETDMAGEHVILVEDIVDTGMTLNYLLHYLRSREPASLKVCALLDKRVRRIADVPIDYVGFQIPDEFVVGYGLDYMETYRNLPFIGVLNPDARIHLLPQEGEREAVGAS